MSGVVPEIQAIEAAQQRQLPAFRPGDQVEVHYRIKEGEKERIQVFKGVVIRRKGGANRETFTVRKVSYGVGVERIFPVHSPKIDKLDVVSRGHVRRACWNHATVFSVHEHALSSPGPSSASSSTMSL